MRKLLAVAGIVAAIGCIQCVCALDKVQAEKKEEPIGKYPAQKTLALILSNSGSTNKVRIGQAIVVSLGGNPTTGYSWKLQEIEGDSVTSDGVTYKSNQPPQSDPEKEPATGFGGMYTAKFTAARAGKSVIKLVYIRPWEKDKQPVETFEAVILVER